MENVKQLLILNRNLTIKKILSINKVIPIQDIISPQKTTFEIVKSKDIVIGDLLVLKRENKVEYIGIIQDIETDITTKLASYPLISITDIDCIMGNIKGNVFNWIKDVFEYNLVNTLTDSSTSNYIDNLLALPFEFKDNTNAKTLELEVSNGNLFDVLIDIFKKTGIYLSFDLRYIQGRVSNILVSVNISNEETKTILRYDNPIIIEEPNIESSQNQDVNKIIFVPNSGNTKADAKNIYVFYLLDNNTVSTNPNGTDTGKRINGVKQTITEYSDDDYTKGLQSIAEETMLGNTLDHQITIKILQNSGFDVQLYDRVAYIDTQKSYDTYVTRIENYNDKYKTIRLGVLRTTLTDKIKNLEKMLSKKTFGGQVSGGSSGGGSSVNIYDGLDSNSTTDALSARQGKILNELINEINADLVNFYTKNETYSKTEVNSLVSAIPKFEIKVVDALPTTNISSTTIYLLTSGNETSNIFTEYIYVNSNWEKLGEQNINLTDYVNIETFNKLVNNTTQIVGTNGQFMAGGAQSAGTQSISIGKDTTSGDYGNSIGSESKSLNFGVSMGYRADNYGGVAIGSNATSGMGVAIGISAKTTHPDGGRVDAIQLGTGTNSTGKSLQVYDDNIYNANTHTLTVKNINLNGKDINNLMGETVVDAELSETSENPVQNKVLYNPVSFAESERLKSQNLFDVSKASASRSLFATWGISLVDILKEEMIGKRICINFNAYCYVIQISNYTYLDAETDTNKIYYISYNQSYLTFEVTQDLYNNRASRYLNVYSDVIPKGHSNFANLIANYGDKLMVTYGAEPQSYQAYNGDIIHKKQLEKELETVENVDLIYDFSSSDSAINLGYTGGILGGSGNILTYDFSKYKRLRVYSKNLGYQLVTTIDLTNLGFISSNGASVYSGTTAGMSGDEKVIMLSKYYVDPEKTFLNMSFIGYYNGGFQNRNNTANYYFYKVEGVY